MNDIGDLKWYTHIFKGRSFEELDESMQNWLFNHPSVKPEFVNITSGVGDGHGNVFYAQIIYKSHIERS